MSLPETVEPGAGWREDLEAELDRLRRLEAVLMDLNRCRHGRHEGDACHGCSGGVSLGNHLLAANGRGEVGLAQIEPRQVGFDIGGNPILVPDRQRMHDPAAWTVQP